MRFALFTGLTADTTRGDVLPRDGFRRLDPFTAEMAPAFPRAA